MRIDLTKLSDKELFELAKDIKAESKAREDTRLYKRNLGLGADRWYKYSDTFTQMYKERGWDGKLSTEYDAVPGPDPIHTIQDCITKICDLATGNFTIKQPSRRDKPRFNRIERSAQLIQHKPEEYKKLWYDILSLVDKSLGYEEGKR